MLYARIDNGILVELVTVPAGLNIGAMFHTDVATQFVAVPNGVAPSQGWTYSNGTFSPPSASVSPQQALGALVTTLEQKELAGVYYTPDGASAPILFPTDPGAQTKYTAVWNSINSTPPLRNDGEFMIAADGTPVPMTNANAKAMIQKALAYFQGCTARYAVLQPQVLANPATDVSTGWPSNS